MKQKKTNAARRLDELKIAYRLMEYTVDEEIGRASCRERASGRCACSGRGWNASSPGF